MIWYDCECGASPPDDPAANDVQLFRYMCPECVQAKVIEVASCDILTPEILTAALNKMGYNLEI